MTFALDGKFLTSDYDDDADILYLWVESPCSAVTYETSQGHVVQLDPETRVRGRHHRGLQSSMGG